MVSKQKILIVDDDNNIAELISLYLTKECYDTQIVNDGEEALRAFETFRPNLILLDLMLPGVTGEKIISYVRDELKKSIPIIVLSAKNALENKLETMKNGADDYITKPFEPEEVLVRVMAVLRRSGQSTGVPKGRELAYKKLTLNENAREAAVNGQGLSLTPHEFEILRILMSRPDKVFSRENLYEQVWENGYYGEDNTVNVHVSNIRKKIAAADPGEEYIRTVWGIGFKMA